MKTKLITLTWRGSASVDPRFSASMLPWSIADIRNREIFHRLSVGIENGYLEAYNSDFELQFKHHLKHIVGMCRMSRKSDGRNKYFEIGVLHAKGGSNFMEIWGTQNGIIYLLKDPRDPLLHIHLYESEAMDEMTELMQQMRDPSQTLGGSVGNIPQSIVSAPGSSDVSLQKALRGQGIHSTPASNLKISEALRNAQHDGGPSIFSPKLTSSKSFSSGLSSSAGTINSQSQSGNLALLTDISPSHSQFFEVMYVGKIKVSHKRVPDTFIDDALPKFKAYDAQRIKMQAEAARRNSSASETSGSMELISMPIKNIATTSSSNEISSSIGGGTRIGSANELRRLEEDDSKDNDRSQDDDDVFHEKILNTKLSEENKENSSPKIDKFFIRGQSQSSFSSTRKEPLPPSLPTTIEETPKLRDRSASIGSIPVVDQNRTMVFLVGRSDLRLISPDRKQVLLYKDFKDIVSCAQGHKNADHFGIICREVHNEGYIAYVFKCQSDHVADDIVAAISQAFMTCSEQKNKEKSQILSCEHCPMLWYHKICNDIEGLNEKKAQSLIFRRIDTLSDEEQQSLLAKYYGAEEMATHSVVQRVQFLMMLLRAHCEQRQQRHIHDTAENRSEFLNQYLGGSTIFMKAKRSLSNSFDHLLKRKGSRDDGYSGGKDVKDIISPLQENVHEGRDANDGGRPKSFPIGSASPSKPQAEQVKSPMIDIFMKVGNSPRDTTEDHSGSWRQAMLHRVVTPSKNIHSDENAQLLSPLRYSKTKTSSSKRTKEELRDLWKTAIKQIILLSRMEKENASLQARQNENEIKKIKLEYDEILPCDKQAADMWESFIDKEKKVTTIRDPKVLLQAIRNGVPRSKRGEVWLYLAEQYNMKTAPVDVKKFPNYNTPYQTLLKSLTEHQHAIFIDLGRTFPNHKYYKQSLGVGQLSLFNLLKAYSILDPELGYCQGLGFICGVLLLHHEEAEAFELLKHLMFKRQMRTKYLPDMKQFQLQLYQLSRLLKDSMPDLYEWLDENDISPTLYAAPWILTVFSSQFPLGFVTRVFDLLFLESPEVIFRVAISLLEIHKEEILKRDNFEDIMDYLKNVLPNVDAETIEKVMRKTFTTDISRQLTEYHVEYNVLQEEITTQNHHLETLNRAKEENHQLETQLQIAQSSIAQLEKTRFTQQSQIQSLQSQIQSLEVTVETLGHYINQLIETRHDIELPGEIRRIAQQIQNAEQRKKPVFIERKIGKSTSVNSHLGLGLALRVLEEANENEVGTPTKKRTPFFENTYEQIRQQKSAMRLNSFDENRCKKDEIKLPDHVEKAINNMKSPISENDSGIATPLSPQSSPASDKKIKSDTEDSNSTNSIISVDNITANEEAIKPEMHPFSNCGDVNFKYNGTTQLKTIKPVHHQNRSGAIPRTMSQDGEQNGRS